MSDVIKFKGSLSLYDKNELGFPGPVIKGFRFSAWRDLANFAVVEVDEIQNVSQQIQLGETALVILSFLKTKIPRSLQIGQTIYCGSPNKKIGEFKIQEIFSE